MLIKKVKIDQFKQTLSDLESSFDELFDTGFKFENIFFILKVIQQKLTEKWPKKQFFPDFEDKNYLNPKNYLSFGKGFLRPFRCRFQVEKIPLG